MQNSLIIVLVVQLCQIITAAPAIEEAEKNELIRSKRNPYYPNSDCEQVQRIKERMISFFNTLDTSNQGQQGEIEKLNDGFADLIKFLKTWHCNCHKKCRCCQAQYPGWGYPGWGYPGWGYPGWGNGYPCCGNGYPVGPEMGADENLYTGMIFPVDYNQCSCGRPNGCCLPTCNSYIY